GAGNANATDVVLDDQGRIIVAGFHEQGGFTRVSVLRFTDDGKLDEAFGDAQDQTAKGMVNVAFSEGNNSAAGLSLAGDKLTLVGGGTTGANGKRNIALMRLLAN
ncbi:hypothetical protein WDZ92_46090, partial [Nostoc sp. NIES-2111]